MSSGGAADGYQGWLRPEAVERRDSDDACL